MYFFIPGLGAEPGMTLYEVPFTAVLTCTETKRLMLKKAQVESVTAEIRREVLRGLGNRGW